MNNQELQNVVKKQIKTRNRANNFTFISGTFLLVYGMTFTFLIPGINAVILGSMITVFGVFIFGFSVASKKNNK